MKISYFSRPKYCTFYFFYILKGHPRNTGQMFRADQMKFAAYRQQNTDFQFCSGHLATHCNGHRCTEKYSSWVLCIWAVRSHIRCVYGAQWSFSSKGWPKRCMSKIDSLYIVYQIELLFLWKIYVLRRIYNNMRIMRKSDIWIYSYMGCRNRNSCLK